MEKLRFKGYFNAWERIKLDEFGQSTGGTSIEKWFDVSGKYKVISIGSYSESSKYNDQGLRSLDNKKTRNRVLNKDDLAMVLNDKTASGRIIGRTLLIDKNDTYVYNQRTQRIEPNKEKFDPIFLYQFLNASHIRKKIIKQAQGNTQIYVNWSSVKETEYLIPKLDEQRIIGSFLTWLDSITDNSDQKMNQFKLLKKGYLQKMFPKKGENVPEIRFNGFTETWEQREFGKVLTTHPFKQYISEATNDGQFEVIQQGATSIIGYSNGEPFQKYDDIVLFGDHTVSIYKPRNPFLIATDGIKILSSPYLKGEFLYYTLEKYKPAQQGYTRHFLMLKEIEISVPKSETEQEKIAFVLTNLDNLITLHQRKHELLTKLKQGYMQRLFRE